MHFSAIAEHWNRAFKYHSGRGWMDGWMDGWADGRTDGLMDGWMDGWMDVFLASLFSCVGGVLATGRCQVSRSPTNI